MDVVEGVKKGSKQYIHNEFVYCRASSKNGKYYLKCRITTCPARGVLEADMENFQPRGRHNHPKDTEQCMKLRFREKLSAETTQSTEPLKKVYYDAAENNQNAAITYSYVSAKRRMQRRRREMLPPIPKNLHELSHHLESEAWQHLGRTKTDPSQPFYRCLIYANDGAEILIFSSPVVAEQFDNTSIIHVDGTFKIVPHGFNGIAQQLTTIHVVYQNKVYAAVYALMSKQTTSAYVALLSHVKTMYPQMQPEESMTDFEAAEREAILQIFPEIRTRGCWFHFAKAVWKKHRQLGLFQLCQVDSRARKILQMCMSLPLLPEAQISTGIAYVQQQLAACNLSLNFSTFMAYIDRYWMQQVGPHVLSVYGCVKRTNNDVESFHNQLFLLSGKQPHPSVWDFVRILVTMNSQVTLKFLTHRHGGTVSEHPKRAVRNQDSQIREAGILLLSGVYTVGNFLERVSYSVSSMERSLRSSSAADGSAIILADEDINDPDAPLDG